MKFGDRPSEAHKMPLNPFLQTVDLTKPQIEQTDIDPSLPRHIAHSQPNLVSKSRKKNLAEEQLNPYSEADILNLCPAINFYQTESDRQNEELAELHLDNIRQNLARRIEAARLAGNDSLLETLEQELKELTAKKIS